MTRRRSKTRLRLALAGATLLVLNVAVFAAVTWPRLTRVRRAEQRAQEVAARRTQLENLWSQVVARRELVGQNRRDIETLSRDLLKPRATDLFAAQREIEAMARESGLKPSRSSYTLQEIKGTGLVRCEIALPLDGTYANLTSFLSRIETAERFVVVNQMALNSDETGATMNLSLWAVFRGGGDVPAS